MSATFYELLKYAKTGIASPEMTHYDNMKALSMCKAGFPVKTLTGITPLTFQSDGAPLTAWSISGAMTQTGTPTPSAPIQPEETGNKTANLWDEDYTGISASLKYVPVYVGNETVTISTTCKRTAGGACIFLLAGNVSSGAATNTNGAWAVSGSYVATTRTVQAVNGYVTIAFRHLYDGDVKVAPENADTMLNAGDTAKPYERYGYAIPISCGGATQTIYLQEPLRKIGDYADKVEQDGTVTRRIKELVFNGTEDVSLNIVDKNRLIVQVIYTLPYAGTTTATNILCSHLPVLSSGSATSMREGIAMRNNGTDILFGLSFSLVGATTDDTNATIRTKVKSYLAAQYAAGTPVTVWYVLATAQTETVTVPTITPAKGANTLSVGTTLPPSEVSITGKIKAS